MIDREGSRPQRRVAKSSRSIWAIALAVAGCAVAAGSIFGLAAYFAAPSPPQARVKDQLLSGSIVMSSPNSDTCIRHRFDNATGQVRNEAVIDCEKLGGKGQGTRIESIASGFRGR